MERLVVLAELRLGCYGVAGQQLDGARVDRDESGIEPQPKLLEGPAGASVVIARPFEVADHRAEVGEAAKRDRLPTPVPLAVLDQRFAADDALRCGRRTQHED